MTASVVTISLDLLPAAGRNTDVVKVRSLIARAVNWFDLALTPTGARAVPNRRRALSNIIASKQNLLGIEMTGQGTKL